jgi:2,2-dialkylglycine decarboxylase (pyruvate)
VTDRGTRAPANAQARIVAEHCLEHGLIFQLRGVSGMMNVIRLVPPMTTSDEEIDRAMSILRDALRVASRMDSCAAAG